MPRFYFDIREGPRFTPDEEGLEFASLDGAEREATKAVAEIGRDRLPSGGARDIGIEVRNEHHRFVLAVELPLIRVKESHGDSEYTVLNTASAAFYSAQRKRDLPPHSLSRNSRQALWMAGPEAELKGFRARKWVETP